MDFSKIDMSKIGQSILESAPALLLALFILFIGRLVARKVGVATERAFNKRPNANAMLSRFFGNVVRTLILLATIIAALTFLGINTTSMSGMILGMGVAFAFILKNALSDVAAGIMLIVFRPYSLGDEIEIDGFKGVVTAIGLIATRMKTRNNVEMIVQNGKAWGGVIQNHNAYGKRRLDTVFGVSYDADIDTAIAALIGTAKDDPRVYKDPAPWAKVVKLGDSSVDIELRIWCDYDDMRKIKMDIAQPVKVALDKAGVGIPYPHEIKHIQKLQTN
ncbi:MAG: mechanosensitive ion channel family protein [Robiginitomaculum sp.]